MKKLTLDDIEIKSPGKQAKALIFEKYGSVQKFSKAIDIAPRTIYQYLKRTDLGSAKFKLKFIDAFNSSFNELILTKENQIKRFVDIIFDDIPKYTSIEDLQAITEVMKLCIEEDLKLEIIRMERNKAMYYLRDNRIEHCIEMLQELISKVYRLKYYNHWLYFNCDLARAYGSLGDYATAQKVFNNLNIDVIKEAIDNHFKNRAQYKYYYGFGVLNNRMGNHDQAKILLEKSIKCTDNIVYIGASTMNIGLSYKKKGNFDKALDYYFNALDIQTSKEHQTTLYNNIGEIYKQKGQYEIAIQYIEKAKKLIEKYNIKRKYTTFITYLEIKVLEGFTENALLKLINWTTKYNGKFVDTEFLVSGLNTIIDLSKKLNSHTSLRIVEDSIMDLIYKSENQVYIKELQCCLGSISRFFYEENFGRR